jgi:hypothetical protein
MAVITTATALEGALAELLQEHDLRLLEVTWKKNLEKQTLSLGLKVTGDLNQQVEMPLA